MGMERSVVLVVLAVLAAAALAVHPGSHVAPRADHAHSLIQQADGDDAGADGAQVSDEAVVVAHLAPLTVNPENLKAFIRERGVTDAGVMGDLIARAACIVRLEQETGSTVSSSSLQEFLTSRELSMSGSKDELLDRSCDYLSKEMVVRSFFGRPLGDITKDDLKSALTSLGFFSTVGTKPELVFRLGKAKKDIAAIRELLDPAFEVGQVQELLTARGLATEGSAGVLLGRLADYLVVMSEQATLPGVSSHCDIVTESSICIAGGEKVFAPDAKPKGLVGKWTFDDAHMLDHSGNAHHSKEAVPFGPGLNGLGQSAKFDTSNMLELPHSDHFSSADFCVTYWMYLLADSTGQWRTVLHKGTRDNERTPTFFLEPQTRGIEMFVSTTDDSQPAGERLWSNTFIPLRRWTHIAGCAEGRNLRLYINGILDAENTTVGSPVMNNGPMYVGNDPWRPAGGIAGYVDELRFYSRVLTTDEIQAEAQSALGGVEPAFVELGCMSCSLDNCAKTCRKGYHVCSTRDLHAGGFHVARGMGWAAYDTRIWASEDGKAETADASSGLCVCCKIGEA